MLNFKILGPGCYNCMLVEQVTAQSLDILIDENPELEATIQHVQDPSEINNYPILFTPGLVLNEKLVCAGRIPTVDEITGWVKDELKVEESGQEVEKGTQNM